MPDHSSLAIQCINSVKAKHNAILLAIFFSLFCLASRDLAMAATNLLVGFSLRYASNASNKAEGVVEISSDRRRLFGTLNPSGLMSPQMGSPEEMFFCQFCTQGNARCTGHYGIFPDMPPFLLPYTTRVFVALANSVCGHCKQLVVPTLLMEGINQEMEAAHRSNSAQQPFQIFCKKITKQTPRTSCQSCGHAVQKYAINNTCIISVMKVPEKHMLTPPELSSLRDLLLASQLGQVFHWCLPAYLDQMVQTTLLVLPTNMRMPTIDVTKQAPRHSGLTLRYTKIYTNVGAIQREDLGRSSGADQYALYMTSMHRFFHPEEPTGAYEPRQTNDTIMSSFGGNKGIIRTYMTTTVIWRAGRAVMCCASDLPMDRIRFTEEFCRPFCIPEYVFDYSHDVICDLMRARPLQYNTAIISGTVYNAQDIDENIIASVEPGDIIFRSLRKDDPFLASRPPILQHGNIIGMRVEVLLKTAPQENGACIQDNIQSGAHGGDFDGDTGYTEVAERGAGQADAGRTLSLPRQYVNSVSGTSYISLTNNAQLAAVLFSERQIEPKSLGILLLSFSGNFRPETRNKIRTIAVKQKRVRFGDLISSLLPTHLSYSKMPGIAKLLGHGDTAMVHIEQGRYLGGLLDNTIVGGGQNTLWSAIASSGGYKEMSQVCNDTKQLLLALQHEYGTSIDMNELELAPLQKKRYDSLRQSVLKQIQVILHSGYMCQLVVAGQQDEFHVQTIMERADWIGRSEEALNYCKRFPKNTLKSIIIGLQSKHNDLYVMLRAHGLVRTMGHAMEAEDGGRTSPRYPKNSLRANSYGYVENNSLSGYTMEDVCNQSRTLIVSLQLKSGAVGQVSTWRRLAIMMYSPIVSSPHGFLVAGSPYTCYTVLASFISFTNSRHQSGQTVLLTTIYSLTPEMCKSAAALDNKETCAPIEEFLTFAREELTSRVAQLSSLPAINTWGLFNQSMPFDAKHLRESWPPHDKMAQNIRDRNRDIYLDLINIIVAWPYRPDAEIPAGITERNLLLAAHFLIEFPILAFCNRPTEEATALADAILALFTDGQMEGGLGIGIHAAMDYYQMFIQNLFDAPKKHNMNTDVTDDFHYLMQFKEPFTVCTVSMFVAEGSPSLEQPKSLIYHELGDFFYGAGAYTTFLFNGKETSVPGHILIEYTISTSELRAAHCSIGFAWAAIARDESLHVLEGKKTAANTFTFRILCPFADATYTMTLDLLHDLCKKRIGSLFVGGIRGIFGAEVAVQECPIPGSTETVKRKYLIVRAARMEPLLEIPGIFADTIVFDNFHTHTAYFGILSTRACLPWRIVKILDKCHIMPAFTIAAALVKSGAFLNQKPGNLRAIWPNHLWLQVAMSHAARTLQQAPLLISEADCTDPISSQMLAQCPPMGPNLYRIVC